MGHIAKHSNATPARVDGPPQLSEKLKAAIETPTAWAIGDKGFDTRPGTWKPPAMIDRETQIEATDRLKWMEAVQMPTAGTDTMRNWLIALGNAVASSSAMTEKDVQAKVGALMTMLEDYPAGVFTTASLKRAGRQFTFFPGSAELMKLLDQEADDLKAKRNRLRILASTKPAPANDAPAETYASTPEQQAAVRAMLDGIGIGLKRQMGNPDARAEAEDAAPTP